MKVIASSDVPKLIPDGATVTTTGITLGGFPEESIMEIEASFLETGHPRNLTFFWQAAVGDMNTKGLSHLCHEGLMTRGIGGHLNGCGRAMTEFSRDNKAEIYNWPQGVCMDMLYAVAAQQPGVVTKIGLGTFMDPRQDCGRMNEAAQDSLIELLELDGEEYLLYKAPKTIDVALIRGTTADENGNITMEHEGYKLGQLAAAEAARASGGIVICQVERIAEAGSLNPRLVEVPGVLVDYVYVAKPEYHWQTAASTFNPVFCGDVKAPLSAIPPIPLSVRKVIARRAAMELREGDIVNLGVGNPSVVSNVAAEEGCSSLFTLTTEAGSIGGVPAAGNDFGCAWNAEAIIESRSIFDMYDGGSLDVGYLGFLQIAPNGDLNASKRDGLGIGVGGFMNVAGGASEVVFMGTFTGGKTRDSQPKLAIADGKLTIDREGDAKKFVGSVDQVSFSAKVALDLGKKILYVTERAVFELVQEGLKLIEIAPGVDLQKDVLDQMEFTPLIADDLKEMPAKLFQEDWGDLAEIMASGR